MAQYYYLISSLPELSFTDDFQKHPYLEFDAFAGEELEENDHRAMRLCFLFNDLVNLVAVSEYPSRDLLYPAYYDSAALAEGLDDPDLLFPFMGEFIRRRRAEDLSEPEPVLRRELFGDMMRALADREIPGLQEFVHDFLTFEARLKNLAAALTLRAAGKVIAPGVVPFDHFSLMIRQNPPPDFGLGGELGSLGLLIEEVNELSPLEFESRLTAARWQWLDEAVESRIFSAAAVQAVAVKIADVQRWLSLSPEAGKAKLDEIMGQLHDQLPSAGREDTA